MGTAERKEREKERRRLDIIDAAEDVFFSKGFEKTTMDDIAKEAELGKGTLYLYFDSKEDIYGEICNRGMNILNNLFAKAIADQPNGISKVRKIGEAFIKFYKNYQNYYQVFLYMDTKGKDIEINNVSKKAHQSKEVGMELFFSVIEEGIKDGSISPELDPKKTAILLWAESAGVLQLMQNKGKMINELFGINEHELLNHFFDFTEKALRP